MYQNLYATFNMQKRESVLCMFIKCPWYTNLLLNDRDNEKNKINKRIFFEIMIQLRKYVLTFCIIVMWFLTVLLTTDYKIVWAYISCLWYFSIFVLHHTKSNWFFRANIIIIIILFLARHTMASPALRRDDLKMIICSCQ